MQAELPGVPIGFDHLGLAGHVSVVVMGDVALPRKKPIAGHAARGVIWTA